MNRRLAFCDLASEFSIILNATDFFVSGAPLELWIWNFNRSILWTITIHVKVSEWKLELTCWQNVDRFCWKNVERVNHSELLSHHRDRLVTGLIKFDSHTSESRLKTSDKEKVGLLDIFGAGVWRAELFDDFLALRDGPVKLEAVQRVEDIVIVVVSNYVKLLVAVDAELSLACEDVKSVDLTNFHIALKNSAGVCK